MKLSIEDFWDKQVEIWLKGGGSSITGTLSQEKYHPSMTFDHAYVSIINATNCSEIRILIDEIAAIGLFADADQ